MLSASCAILICVRNVVKRHVLVVNIVIIIGFSSIQCEIRMLRMYNPVHLGSHLFSDRICFFQHLTTHTKTTNLLSKCLQLALTIPWL